MDILFHLLDCDLHSFILCDFFHSLKFCNLLNLSSLLNILLSITLNTNHEFSCIRFHAYSFQSISLFSLFLRGLYYFAFLGTQLDSYYYRFVDL